MLRCRRGGKLLWSYRYTLRKGKEGRAKETEDEKEIIQKLLEDLLLRMPGWEVKNAWHDIFQRKTRTAQLVLVSVSIPPALSGFMARIIWALSLGVHLPERCASNSVE